MRARSSARNRNCSPNSTAPCPTWPTSAEGCSTPGPRVPPHHDEPLPDDGLTARGVAVMRSHASHQVLDAGELLGHLVAQHDYTAEALSGGTTVFLRTLHSRAHQQMANDLTGTIPELTGSAERLFTAALETVESLLALDRDLVRRLATRWAEALHVLTR